MFYQEGRTVKLDLNDHFNILIYELFDDSTLYNAFYIVEIITTISINPSNNILLITNILYFNFHVKN